MRTRSMTKRKRERTQNTTNLKHHNKKRCLVSGVDRITYLQESEVSHILSCLPSKEAVRNSILSKAWKSKFTTTYTIDIENIHGCYWGNRAIKTIIRRTDMLLLSCKYLRVFRFKDLGLKDTSCIQRWIPAILNHNLECFEVDLNARSVVYPCSLLNSTTSLRKLSLCSGTLNVATKISAPNLVSLDLYDVNVVNENSKSGTVTFNFPVLKTFTYRYGEWLGVKCVEIYAPLLDTFEYDPYPGLLYRDYDYTIDIVAPRLTMLNRRKCSFLVKNVMLNKLPIDHTFIKSRKWWVWVTRTIGSLLGPCSVCGNPQESSESSTDSTLYCQCTASA